eukprot:scaffold24155_cov89-Cyclotella_meneghiniana.AAC.2
MEVRIEFERKRVEICKLLVLDGYRRKKTAANLPSNGLRSSQPLTELCSKKGVTPLSKFPSVAGVSKLKKSYSQRGICCAPLCY